MRRSLQLCLLDVYHYPFLQIRSFIYHYFITITFTFYNRRLLEQKDFDNIKLFQLLNKGYASYENQTTCYDLLIYSCTEFRFSGFIIITKCQPRVPILLIYQQNRIFNLHCNRSHYTLQIQYLFQEFQSHVLYHLQNMQ